MRDCIQEAFRSVKEWSWGLGDLGQEKARAAAGRFEEWGLQQETWMERSASQKHSLKFFFRKNIPG